MAESSSAIRHLPNAISMARIIATPVLVYVAVTGREEIYTWLLLAALLSDIADGLIARSFSLTSELGSRLDTLADTLLWVAAICGIWVFHRELFTEYWPLIVLVLGTWALEHAVALIRYGKLTSFHTYTNRASAYVLSIFVMSMFFFGIQPWLLYAGAAVNILANVEQLAIIAVLPEWTANVRGLYWVLQERKFESA